MNIKTANSPAAVEVVQTVTVPLWYDEGAHEIRIDDTNPNAPEMYRLVKRVFADVRTPLDEAADAKAALDRLRELIGDSAGDYAAECVEAAREAEREDALQTDANKVMSDVVEKYRDIPEADGFDERFFKALCRYIPRKTAEGLAYRASLLCYLYGYEAGKAATP